MWYFLLGLAIGAAAGLCQGFSAGRVYEHQRRYDPLAKGISDAAAQLRKGENYIILVQRTGAAEAGKVFEAAQKWRDQ